MKTAFIHFTPASIGAFLMCIGLTDLSSSAISAYAEEAKASAPRLVLAETYNAVTRIYFTNTAVHKVRTNPASSNDAFELTSSTGLWTPSITSGANLASATLP